MGKQIVARCALCEQTKPLVESHIISSFVGRWIKSTGSGYFRQPRAPNKKNQDLTKIPLLCIGCEAVLNRSETPIASRVFRPYLRRQIRQIECDETLLHFAAGLIWRAVAFSLLVTDQNDRPKFFGEVVNASNRMKGFVLDPTKQECPYEIHLLLTPPVIRGLDPCPTFLKHSIQHNANASMIESSDSVTAISRIPGFIFLSPIVPRGLPGWSGTMLEVGTTTSEQQQIEDHHFAFYLVNSSLDVAEKLAQARDKRISEAWVRAIGPYQGINERLTLAWDLADALARRQAPQLVDSTTEIMATARRDEIRKWPVVVTSATYRPDSMGGATEIVGRHPDGTVLTFFLRGEYEAIVDGFATVVKKGGWHGTYLELLLTSK